jgi:hypothetical protein
VPGKWVVIDEQTLGFHGASGMKLRISYKREGGGFQCDAVWDAGYAYSFYFLTRTSSKCCRAIQRSGAVSCRVVWLASCLPNQWTRLYMDNLVNSKKLYKALYTTEALVHGVACTNGWGIPPSIIQKEEKNINCAEQL